MSGASECSKIERYGLSERSEWCERTNIVSDRPSGPLKTRLSVSRNAPRSFSPKDITFVFNYSYTSLYWTQEWRKAACSGCRILIFFSPLLFILLAKAEIHVLWIRFIGPLMSLIVEFKCRYKFVSLKAIQFSRVTKICLFSIARFNCKINALC